MDHDQRQTRAGCDCPSGSSMASGPAGPSRRSFLRAAGVTAAVAGLSTTSTRLSFGAPGSAGQVMVVLSLRGGFDGLNVVVPSGDAGYALARPTIGIPPSKLLPLTRMFGLHPAMAPLLPLWKQGSFGAVHAVGQAAATRSHFAAMEEMERAAPGTSMRTGWIDRTLGMTKPTSPLGAVQLGRPSASSHLAGPAPEVATRDLATFRLRGSDPAKDRQRWERALSAMYADSPPQVAAPARAAVSALGAVATVSASTAAGTGYPERSQLGAALRDVAVLIKGGSGLQVAAVDYGDWDMHAGMGTVDGGWMTTKLTELASCLAAFVADIGAANYARTTVVTLSEFGRRVGENASQGVDHGHGNAVLLLGGNVAGGKVHGRWPGLGAKQLVDGDLAGTTDYRQVVGEVLTRRMGVTSLGTVFPGLKAAPLGLLR